MEDACSREPKTTRHWWKLLQMILVNLPCLVLLSTIWCFSLCCTVPSCTILYHPALSYTILISILWYGVRVWTWGFVESLQVGFGFVRRLDDFKVRSLRVTARFIRRQGKLRFQLVAMVVKFLDGHESSMGTLIFKVSPVNPVKTCTPLDLFWGSRIMSGKV